MDICPGLLQQGGQGMTYIIAEIGQNHNGSTEVAAALIDMCARPTRNEAPSMVAHRGVDAVKLTKRDLTQECIPSMMAAPYDSLHAFGSTYGEHRAALELTGEEHHDLYDYAKAQALDFVETLCAIGCVEDICGRFTPDRLKVASRDLTNLPLLAAMAETEIPIILSTGMADLADITDAIDTVSRYHNDISVLHCLSAYPAPYADLNLYRIPSLKAMLGRPVGYSDHSLGIAAPVAAVAMGATIIEKHVTLDRSMRGSDHAGSLERDGLWRMVRDIRNVEAAFGDARIYCLPSAERARLKLERSCVTSADLPEGAVVTESDITLMSPGGGVKWRDRHTVIGQTLTEAMPAGTIFHADI
jgi:3-deoxy-D-glycero-D-galacto-nononate 9-phosphate synthase